GRAIQAKLSAKGLKREQIEEALAEHADDRPSSEVDLIAALRLARRKKLGPFSTKDPVTPDKDLATLARAGFGYDIASRVIRMDKEPAEELLL
ncbi:MAG: RecX family transcriptional regulator, partial [Alphaproteobacteria bacterium]|nr:RecX family transcriptional regulator [Alphaproteobacteria bacterium]